MILTATIALTLSFATSPPAVPDTVVLLVDFQRDFATSTGAWPADPSLSRQAIDGATELVNAAHARGWSVVRVANAFSPWDPGNLFRRRAAIRGSSGAQWVLADSARQGALFSKTGPDGFASGSLSTWFESHSESVIWVAGFFTEGCVLSTAKSAIDRGHTVLSSPSLVASVDSASWRKGWSRLQKAGVVDVPVP